ncbi:MAG: ABC transporter substrate-binding protein [Cyanobacteriota bacterium]|nr:ABC transporter substrate-binding protein [Cyanobacteriota bacterium]
MTRKKIWRFTGLVLSVATLAMACDKNDPLPTVTPPRPSESEAETLVWGRYGDADTLDPHKTASPLSRQILDQIYDTLLAFDEKGELQPNLAKEWSVSDDGLEYTFTLNEGIKCHDGTAFDAEGVKFTIERAINEETRNPTRESWGSVEAVEVADELTVKVKFSEPFAPFAALMADPFGSMVCPSGANNYGDRFGIEGAIGTGPFKFVEWQQGDRLVLEANPDYQNYGRRAENAGVPFIKKLVVKTMPDAEERLAAVKSGEVHLSEPPLEDISEIKDDGNLKFYAAENTGQIVFLEFVTTREPFNEKNARLAVAYAIDPEAVSEEVLPGLAKPSSCPVGDVMFPNDGKLCDEFSLEPDREKAKSLLTELGYSEDEPLEVTLLTWSGGKRKEAMEIFQSQLEEVGIKAEVEVMDIGALNARIEQENSLPEGKGVVDMMGWSWHDPDFLYTLWHSPGWMGGYHSDELDGLLKEMRSTIDSEERKEKVEAVQKYLLENAVMVPLYSPGWLSNYVTSEEVEGFKVAAFNRPVFNDVKLPSGVEEKEEVLEEEKPEETSVEEEVKDSDAGEVLEEEKLEETSVEEEVNRPEATAE